MRKYSLSLSLSNGKVAERHSRRWYTPPSADASLAGRNVHVIDPTDDAGSPVTYRDQFNAMFAGAIARYNGKQTRVSRYKTHDYWSEIDGGKRKEKPVYSSVIQLGSRETCGVCDLSFDAKAWRALRETDAQAAAEYVADHIVDDEKRRRVKAVLIEVAERWETWFPHLRVVSAVIHDDEPAGTVHLDVNWVPVAGGDGSNVYKAGMDTRCALNKALEQMGYTGKGYAYAIKEWQADAKQNIEDIMALHGLERENMHNTERHKDVPTYIMEQERKEEAARCAELRRRAVVAEERAERAQEDEEAAREATKEQEVIAEQIRAEIAALVAQRDTLRQEVAELRGVKERSPKTKAVTGRRPYVAPSTVRNVDELFIGSR